MRQPLLGAAVPNRNSETITNVLQEWVLPGSILYTGCWHAYLNTSINSGMSTHFTVNHEREFVTTENVHTQNIENLWSVF